MQIKPFTTYEIYIPAVPLRTMISIRKMLGKKKKLLSSVTFEQGMSECVYEGGMLKRK